MVKRRELLESQLRMHEQDTKFIGGNDLRFPAVVYALIDLELKSKIIFIR